MAEIFELWSIVVDIGRQSPEGIVAPSDLNQIIQNVHLFDTT